MVFISSIVCSMKQIFSGEIDMRNNPNPDTAMGSHKSQSHADH